MGDSKNDDRKHLALIGAGYSHLQVIRLLSQSRSFHTITLINTKSQSVYRGSLPDYISRQSPDFDPIDLQVFCDTYKIASRSNVEVRFILGRVVDVDFDQKSIYLRNNEDSTNDYDDAPTNFPSSVCYDVLSIDIGSKSKALDEVPGASSYTIPTRPVYTMIESLKEADEHIGILAKKFKDQKNAEKEDGIEEEVDNVHESEPTPVRVAVVGGGANGIEIALACRNRWKTILKDQQLWISLVSKESTLLPEVPSARRKLTEILIQNDVYLHMKAAVDKVESNRLHLTNDTIVPFDHCLWATGAGCHSLPRTLQKRGLSVTGDGWVKIHSTLQCVSHTECFACGDCAALPNPLPKSGVYGLQEGPVLAENLDRYARGKPLVTYEPNTEDLQFLSLGDGTAMGFAFGLVLRGEWVYEVKQAMNRRHYWTLTGYDIIPSPVLSHDQSQTYSYRLNSKVLKDVEAISVRDAALMLNEINIDNYQEAWAILERMSVDKAFRTSVMKQYNKLTGSDGKRRHVKELYEDKKQEQARPVSIIQKRDHSMFRPFKFLSWIFKISYQDDSDVNSIHSEGAGRTFVSNIQQ